MHISDLTKDPNYSNRCGNGWKLLRRIDKRPVLLGEGELIKIAGTKLVGYLARIFNSLIEKGIVDQIGIGDCLERKSQNHHFDFIVI
jgi:hypothetical protein